MDRIVVVIIIIIVVIIIIIIIIIIIHGFLISLKVSLIKAVTA